MKEIKKIKKTSRVKTITAVFARPLKKLPEYYSLTESTIL